MKNLLVLVCSALVVSMAPARAADTSSPEALVKNTVEEVLGAIKQTQDRAALRKVAEQKVLPYFDFAQMTRLAMGPAWRKATPEQQQTLVDNFRELLVNTYTNALIQAGSGSGRTLDVKPGPPAKGSSAAVRTEITEAGKQPLHIDYRLTNESGSWKVYDVIVEGVSLVTNYRSEFSDQVAKTGIDGLIKSLKDRNASLAKR